MLTASFKCPFPCACECVGQSFYKVFFGEVQIVITTVKTKHRHLVAPFLYFAPFLGIKSISAGMYFVTLF